PPTLVTNDGVFFIWHGTRWGLMGKDVLTPPSRPAPPPPREPREWTAPPPRDGSRQVLVRCAVLRPVCLYANADAVAGEPARIPVEEAHRVSRHEPPIVKLLDRHTYERERERNSVSRGRV